MKPIYLLLGMPTVNSYKLRLLLIISFSIVLHHLSISQTLTANQLRDSVETVIPFPDAEKALPVYQRIHKLSTEEGDRDLALYSKIYTSYFNDVLGNSIVSDEETEQAYEMVKDTSSISTSNVIMAYQWMQQLERKRGNLISALDLNKKYIELELAQGVNAVELGISYMELGSGYRIIGDYENAILFPTEALNLFHEAPDSLFKGGKDKSLRLCRALQIRGLAKKDLKKYEESIKDYRESIKHLKQSAYVNKTIGIKYTIDCYSRLAHVYILNGEFDKAGDLLKALPSFLKKEKFNHFRYYELLALLKLKNKEPQAALVYIQQAIETGEVELKGNRESPERARLKMIHGDCYLALDSLALALQHYQKGLQYFDPNLNEDFGNNPDIMQFPEGVQPLQLLEKKADALLLQYKKNKALRTLSQCISTFNAAIKLIGKMKADFVNEGSKYRVAELATAIYQKALEANYLLYEEHGDAANLNTVCNIIEKNKAEILFQNISSKYNLLASELSQELINEGIDLKYNISYYSKLLSEEELKIERQEEKITKLKDKLFQLNESLTFHDQKIKENHPDFYNFKRDIDNQASLADLQNALNPNQIIVEYFQTKEHIYALSIGADQIGLRKDSLWKIKTLVDSFYQEISMPPTQQSMSQDELNALAFRLSTLLLLNDSNYSENLDKIIIVPDGILNKIPFETLLISPAGKMLIEQCNVTYNYSANQYHENQFSELLKNPTVLSITPTFGGEESEERSCNATALGELPYALKEANYLRSTFEGKFFENDAANSNALEQYFPDFPIIHLATHACVNEENPMLSQIHFSNGALTNYDIQNLNARPELVLLSACNTASGQMQDGEGVIGLSRGFFEAGVKGMQSSLWSINDLSSSEIVTGMYAYLKEGKSKSAALRQAKLDYLSKADKLRSHPYYWAAIIHIGNDNPFEFTNYSTAYIGLGLFGIFLVAGLFVLIRKK